VRTSPAIFQSNLLELPDEQKSRINAVASRGIFPFAPDRTFPTEEQMNEEDIKRTILRLYEYLLDTEYR